MHAQLAKSRYLYILRIAVTAGLLAAAFTFGALAYYALSSFENSSAVESFHNVAHYARATLESDFFEKQSVVSGLSKNMAYMKPNATDWPHVVMPGFYDTVKPLRDSANLDDVFFVPIVAEHQLPSFTTFAYDYFNSELAIGLGAGVPSLGIFALGPHGPYQETTGETFLYSSPNRLITPMLQELFGEFNDRASLGINVHSSPQVGPALDAMVECSKHHNYTAAARACIGVVRLSSFPLGSTGDDVTDFHTAFMHPIYLGENTTNLVGFMGGGFSWNRVLTGILTDSVEGVEVVVRNADTTVTFVKHRGTVYLLGFGDHHDRNHNSLEHSITLFAAPDGTETPGTYKVSFYPNAEFYSHYTTKKPIWAGLASFFALSLCAAIFFLYDAFVRGECEANAAVLETKRRFVRFISHEIRTPLNAVHLGLEALTAELAKVLDQMVNPNPNNSVCSDAANCINIMRSWLELTAEMMGNSESAVDVLNDLLNYDKIEMGTLYLDFSAVCIWDVVQTNVAVFHNQIKQKNIHWSLENRLHTAGDDVEHHDKNQFFVVGDSARLAQVMRNLISNALKFTPSEGTITVLGKFYCPRSRFAAPHPLTLLSLVAYLLRAVESVEGGLQDRVPTVPEEHAALLEQPRAGSVRISVTDSGAGLSEAQLAKICSEGVQFNANELQAGKGSGLGLFITKGIVEQHGGKLTVTSGGLGTGTTFSVELPLFILESALTESAALDMAVEMTEVTRPLLPTLSIDVCAPSRSISIDACAAPFTPTNRFEFESIPRTPTPRVKPVAAPFAPPAPCALVRRILVVDDASSNRKMLMRILAAKGYVCEQAEDGQQAIDVYRASVEADKPFYAITMDFEMPVMNGPTATGHLRALGCDVPIIGVTGNLLPDDIKYFKAQGATDVIGKPVSIVKFESLMREHDSH